MPGRALQFPVALVLTFGVDRNLNEHREPMGRHQRGLRAKCSSLTSQPPICSAAAVGLGSIAIGIELHLRRPPAGGLGAVIDINCSASFLLRVQDIAAAAL